MNDIRNLTPGQLDALREVANIGAGHAATALSQMTGLLPITRYNTPAVTSGAATVSSDAQNWIVTATSGTVLRFTSLEK